jgi:hypothetical protein
LIGRDPVVGRNAEAEVAAMGEDALGPLLDLLGQDTWESAPRAARLVGSIGEQAVDPLCELLLNDVREFGASLAFRFLRVPSSYRLTELLERRRSDKTPYMVIRALGEHGDASGAADLVREAAARGHEPNALREIVTALERVLLAQSDASEARRVLDQLRLLADKLEAPVPFTLHPQWWVFRRGSGWLDPVIEAFNEPRDRRRGWSTRALNWLELSNARRAVDVLGRVAADPDEPVADRTAALEALSTSAQEGALEAVARAGTSQPPTEDADRFFAALHAAAARLAWQSGDAADLARDALGRAAQTGNNVARANALFVLGRSGTEGDDEVVSACLVDPDWTVRGAAAIALAYLRGSAAVDRLRKARDEVSEPIERVEVATALARADPSTHADDLHAVLCERHVTALWALVDPLRDEIVDSFEAAGPAEAERAAAWAEVLNIERATSPARASDGRKTVTPQVASATDGAEPGRGTPHAQADLEAMVDHLGRTPLVDLLVGMLDDPAQGTPFTFGLFGGWGEGKSSVLRQLQSRLASGETTHYFHVAWFNAWQYEKTDNLAAGLVQETVRALVPTGPRRLSLAWRFAWRTARPRMLWTLFVLLATAAATVFGLLVVDENAIKAVIGAGGLSIVTAAVALLLKLYRHPFAAELWTYFRLPDYGQHLGLLPVMRQQLGQLWRLREVADESRPSRLVVVVDDLDRCSSSAIAATLDAIRLVMDLAGVMVIVALDERICLRAVAHEYESLTTPQRSENEIARDFLAKIVQLPIRLEPPTSLENFLAHDLFREDGPFTAARVSEAAQTPRPTTRAGDGHEPAQVPNEEERAQDELRQATGHYSSSDVSAGAARLLRETMRETTQEREEFERLAKAAMVRNPRQLRRLRNTYRFIKTTAARLDWRKLMAMLFWQECLHVLNAEQFGSYQGRPVLPLPLDYPLPEALAKATALLFDSDEEFREYREAVVVAVLPRLDAPVANPA